MTPPTILKITVQEADGRWIAQEAFTGTLVYGNTEFAAVERCLEAVQELGRSLLIRDHMTELLKLR